MGTPHGVGMIFGGRERQIGGFLAVDLRPDSFELGIVLFAADAVSGVKRSAAGSATQAGHERLNEGG